MRRSTLFFSCAAVLLLLHIQFVFSQTTEFSYQGSLKNGTTPATGNHDFEFILFDALSGGNQVGPVVTINSVPVTDGTFSVKLNFGNPFISGAPRFLEIRVRPSGQGAMTILSPRQLIGSSPYAIKSLGAFNAESATMATNALSANNALALGGVAANQYVLTNDPRMSDARPPIPGSPSYIQNTTSPQPSSSFNITNTGTANAFNALTQYNLGSFRILSNGGSTLNLLVGVGAGNANPTGLSNTFVGSNAGFNNTGGADNAFFGTVAGQGNTVGSANSFFGVAAGRDNTQGAFNAFFGTEAGLVNTTGGENAYFGFQAGRLSTAGQNAFFGSRSGRANSTGFSNSFFGHNSGQANTIGNENAFFGASAGFFNTSGSKNSFLGLNAGIGNTTGSRNVFIGVNAASTNDVGSNNTLIGADTSVTITSLTYATAVGAGAIVSDNNTIVLGRSGGQDLVRIPGYLATLQLHSSGNVPLCRNPLLVVSTCSSSARYKSNIREFKSGLDLIQKLQPVSYNWKQGGMADIGLVAEDVNSVEPLLTTTNEKDEIEGVKYDRVAVVLINAIKEQQAQIEAQTKLIKSQAEQLTRQQAEIDATRKYICSRNRKAAICRRGGTR